VGTAFYFYGATVLAKAARVLDQPDAALRYADLAARIKESFNAAFYDPQRQLYGNGSQFANAFPLALGLVEPSNQAAVLQNNLDDLQRRNGHFTVGVLGAKYLLEALTEHGRPDVAWQLVNQQGFPGWAHMLEGRNTLSEFWDLKGSHNHAMMGSVDAWFYRPGLNPNRTGRSPDMSADRRFTSWAPAPTSSARCAPSPANGREMNVRMFRRQPEPGREDDHQGHEEEW
jgi:hypothetical protein